MTDQLIAPAIPPAADQALTGPAVLEEAPAGLVT